MDSADFEAILEQKLNSFKDGIATKSSIEELRSLLIEQSDMIKSQGEEIDRLKETIFCHDTRIVKLESQVAILQNTVSALKREEDNTQQYQRRLCLRIVGIPPPQKNEKEDGSACLKKVKEVFSELDTDVPDCSVDRAHRIGEPFKDKNGTPCHSMIVRFTTWTKRTEVYKARKNQTNTGYLST